MRKLTQTTGFESSPAQLADKHQQAWQLPGSFRGDHDFSFSDQLVWVADPTGQLSISQLRLALYMPKGKDFSFLSVSLTQSGMQALKQERARRTREGAPASILAETEDALVGFFIEGCRFEMQAGHMERAVASIQAALEITCFAPSIPVGMLSCVVQLMLCSHLLHCFMLCYAVPCCAVLCCPTLCCAVLCCAVLCCVVLCCAVLCCLMLCCHVLCWAVLRCCCFARVVIIQCCMLGCAVWCLALHTVSMWGMHISGDMSTELPTFCASWMTLHC